MVNINFSIKNIFYTYFILTIEQLLMEAPLGLSDHSVISFKICCDKEISSSVFTIEPPGNPSPEPSRLQLMYEIDLSQQQVEPKLAKLNTSKSVGPSTCATGTKRSY